MVRKGPIDLILDTHLIMRRCIFIAIILPIMVVNPAEIGKRLPDFSCRIMHRGVVEDCVFFHSPQNEGQKTQPFSSSEGLWGGFTTYTNLSIGFAPAQTGYLQVNYPRSEKMNNTSWLVIDLKRMRPNSYRLILDFLPYRPGEINLRWKPSNPILNLTDDPCQSTRALEQCMRLMNSSVILKTIRDSIELTLTDQVVEAVRVFVHGRSCDSGCDEPHPTCDTNLTIVEWSKPSEALRVSNLAPANYCARIVYVFQEYDECCSIYTGTIPVYYAHQILPTPRHYYMTKFFYFMFTVAFLVLFLTLLIHFRFKKDRVKALERNISNSQEQTELHMFRELDPSEIEVLLVYPNNDVLLMQTMKALRKLLRNYVKKVWDPLEENEIENIAKNPAMWTYNVLATPDIKIVLVETEEAVTWYQQVDRTLDIDDMYLSVVSHIHNHPELVFNYRRVHVIRFHKLNSSQDRLNTVPQKRYQMPHQLGLLVMDIIGRDEYDGGTETVSPDMDRFCMLTEKYQSHLETEQIDRILIKL
ncbi:Hypothetical protein NTJ_03117 [Nesidiocoris tenuis]|uniref:SEFIR domain-containing protein n=1 Tax=Nesidiocoris tenuis TaxID=355587 RepID=A0ABN7ADG5_9HEMI|nr:Hypothetical protein NTJ_03117 [Nesidiocoris tenuis]